jgi:DNA-binding NarL/FixJ family response regulator
MAAAPRHSARMVMATGEADVSPLLARIACPTLVLHCRGALLMPIEEARLIASSVPCARFVSLDSENYMPIEGEPAFAHLVDEFRAFLPREAPAAEAVLTGLTQRERQVLGLVARGLDNSSIAAQLTVSEKTVRNTVSHTFDKLAVRSRTQAIVLARKAGLGD